MTAPTLAEWLTAVEVAAAVVSVLPLRTERTVRALVSPTHSFTRPVHRLWVVGRLAQATIGADEAVLLRLAGLRSANRSPFVSSIRAQVALACEVLWVRRYPHVETTVDILRRVADLRITPEQVELAWSLSARGARDSAEALGDLLAQLEFRNRQESQQHGLLELGLGLVQRLFCWPLFYRKGVGASLPIHISTCCDDRARVVLSVGDARGSLTCVPSLVGEEPETLTHSLATAAIAAKETWRAKHGRVETSFRRRIERCSVTFDASLLGATLDALGSLDVLERIVATKQRSLESQVAQAVLASVLHVPAPGTLAATGCLRRSAAEQDGMRNPLDWDLYWPGTISAIDSDSLVEMMLAKVRFAGATGVTRVVVPNNLAKAFYATRASRSALASSGTPVPHVVGVAKLARCIDLCASGPWRPQRLMRSDHLPALADRISARPLTRDIDRALTELRAAFHESSKPGLLIRAPTEAGAALVLAFIRELNRDYLVRSEARPSQIGSLFFQGGDRESGLACLASLRRAIAGVADGAALGVVEEAFLKDSPKEIVDAVAEAVTSWIDHPYSEAEPWQGPELSVFYNLSRLRRDSLALERSGGMPIDVWRLLLQLPAVLGRVSDVRHEAELGRVRAVIVEPVHVERPRLPSEWDEIVLRIDERTPRTTTLPAIENRAGGESVHDAILGALALLRVPSSVGVATSVANVLASAAVPSANWRDQSHQLVGALKRPPVLETGGYFALDEPALERGQRIVANCEGVVRLEAHLVAASCLAPWLGLGELLHHPQLRADRARLVSPPLAPEAPGVWITPECLAQVESQLLRVRHEAQHFRGRDKSNPTFEGLVMRALELLSLVRHHSTADRVHHLRRFLRDGSTALRAWRGLVARRRKGVVGLPFSVQMAGLMTLFSVLRFSGNAEHRVTAARDAVELLDAMRCSLSNPDSPGADALAEGTVALAGVYVQLLSGDAIGAGLEADVWLVIARAEAEGTRLQALGEAFEAMGDSAFVRGDHDSACRWYDAGIAHAPDYQQCAVKRVLVTSGVPVPPEPQFDMVIASLKRTPSPVVHLRSGLEELVARAQSK